MELNEYQKQAMTTCMATSNNYSYMMLNLVGEVGEFASKVAKGIRKGDLDINNDHLLVSDKGVVAVGEYVESLKKEAGDILWQLSGLCHVMDWSLEEIAQMNLDKLQARKQNGTIDGSGDGVTVAERKQ